MLSPAINVHLSNFLSLFKLQTEWKERFPVRNLNAFSVYPLYVYPTHYTGEDGYISDTEESPIIQVVAHAPPTIETNLEGKGLELEVGFNGLAKDEL